MMKAPIIFEGARIEGVVRGDVETGKVELYEIYHHSP